jgi:hypothetical protein
MIVGDSIASLLKHLETASRQVHSGKNPFGNGGSAALISDVLQSTIGPLK